MLGKTNITALQEGAIVDNVEDFRWMKQDTGIFDNFVRTIYKNGYLVGITSGGKIAYTKDGDTWQTSQIKHTSTVTLSDIEWDGTKFLIAGSYLNENSERRGIIFKTDDFTEYEIVDISLISRTYDDFEVIMQILYLGSNYLIITENVSFLTDLISYRKEIAHSAEEDTYAIAKNSNSILFSENTTDRNTYLYIKLITNNGDCILDSSIAGTGMDHDMSNLSPVYVFVCRDNLYACSPYGNSDDETKNFGLMKFAGGAFTKISHGKNFGFISGCYFNRKYVFINKTSMLVFSKESEIVEKTLDDMIDIGAESELSMIISAFDKIFIFGNQGLILKSTNEVNNEEGILVQHMSAKQALAESKRYTDEKIAALEARILVLEEKNT